jgi:hypothetical protein
VGGKGGGGSGMETEYPTIKHDTALRGLLDNVFDGLC